MPGYTNSRMTEIKNNRNLKKKGNYFDNQDRKKRVLTKDTKNLNRRTMSKIGLLRLKAKLKKAKLIKIVIYYAIIGIGLFLILYYTFF